MAEKTSPIINIEDVPLSNRSHGEKFACQFGSMSHLIGSKPMGASVTVVAPGKAAFPAHNHHVTAEMFFIVAGSGELRVGAGTYPVKTGDVIAAPPGGPETAHQIRNTGETELKYLSFSANFGDTDIVEYPDSGKFAATSRFDRVTSSGGIRFIGRQKDSLDYWDGEE